MDQDRHLLAHPTLLSRARHPIMISNDLGRRGKIANNRAPDKLYARSWEARLTSNYWLPAPPPHPYNQHLQAHCCTLFKPRSVFSLSTQASSLFICPRSRPTDVPTFFFPSSLTGWDSMGTKHHHLTRCFQKEQQQVISSKSKVISQCHLLVPEEGRESGSWDRFKWVEELTSRCTIVVVTGDVIVLASGRLIQCTLSLVAFFK